MQVAWLLISFAPLQLLYTQYTNLFGLHWCPSGLESVLQCRDVESIPSWGTKTPPAVGQLSPYSATEEDPLMKQLRSDAARYINK